MYKVNAKILLFAKISERSQRRLKIMVLGKDHSPFTRVSFAENALSREGHREGGKKSFSAEEKKKITVHARITFSRATSAELTRFARAHGSY